MPPSTPSLNPFAQGNPEEIIRRIVDLMPSGGPVDAATQAARAQEQKEAHDRWTEARHGPLPPDTYRVLEQGSFMGWYYELELAGETIVLTNEPGHEYAVTAAEAATLARQHVAQRLGPDAAERARFRKIWGGSI